MHTHNGMTKLVKYKKFIIFLSALSGFPKKHVALHMSSKLGELGLVRINFQSTWIFRCILQRSSLSGWSSAVVEAQKTYRLPVVDPTREDCLARYRYTAPLRWATRYPGSFLHGRHDRLQEALGQNSGSQWPNRWNLNGYMI